jgi:hypothetical protein
MADEIVQSSSPAVTDPTFLSSEALRPASDDDIFAALDRVSSSPKPPPTTRRRGRPPGSKNLTTIQKLAKTDPDAAKKVEEEAKRAAKKARTEELEKQIYGELNDQLMTLLIGSLNINPDWIYLPGKGPVIQKKDERFTELGNMLAIPPNLAHSVGRLAAELENTEVGSKAASVAQNNNVGLIVAGAMTLFGTFQYVKTLSNTFEKLKPIMEARQAAERMKKESENGNGQEPTQPMTEAAVSNSGSVS